MTLSYRRPAKTQRTTINILRSEFITTVARADTVEDARAFIASIRHEMPDASHHVYAFCIGYGNSVTEGMSDDGEPSGTSGPPSLAVLRGSNIGDIVLVTTRYFGGTKLGTGGLVKAYTQAAQNALETLELETKAAKAQIGMDISYSHFESAKRLISEFDATIDDEVFAADVTIIATFLLADVEKFQEQLTNLTAGQSEIVVLETFDT